MGRADQSRETPVGRLSAVYSEFHLGVSSFDRTPRAPASTKFFLGLANGFFGVNNFVQDAPDYLGETLDPKSRSPLPQPLRVPLGQVDTGLQTIFSHGWKVSPIESCLVKSGFSCATARRESIVGVVIRWAINRRSGLPDFMRPLCLNGEKSELRTA